MYVELIGGWLVVIFLVVVGCRSCVRFWMGCWRFVCLGIMVVGSWLMVGCLLLIGDLSEDSRRDFQYPPAHHKLH